ncbi:MAG TPA: peptidoglycan DD-metalloendopeptidase family protein [Anaerolineae bacterium]|nr:peptidoglycan DD-metalloendopeptidase family protein [Anaerolineae bacterium]
MPLIKQTYQSLLLFLLLLTACNTQPTPTPIPTSTPSNTLPTPTLASTRNILLPPQPTIQLEASTPIPPTPIPTTNAPPTPLPSPTPFPQQLTIGTSAQGQPITARRLSAPGNPIHHIKIILVGGASGTDSSPTTINTLYNHLETNPNLIPNHTTIWFIPTWNPDGRVHQTPTKPNGVQLMHNAYAHQDDCPGNNWLASDNNQNGLHPYSAPEAQALLQFSQDAQLVLFYENDTILNQLVVDTCRQYSTIDALAQTISPIYQYPVAPLRDANGYFVDQLAGDGLTTVTIRSRSDTDPARHLQALTTTLTQLNTILTTTAVPATHTWLDDTNTATWQYPAGTFPHPLAILPNDAANTLYMIDGGRVLALNLTTPTTPQTLLNPGSIIDNVRVLEPLDLGRQWGDLYVLDRAGDIYHLNLATGQWQIDRYDRPISDRSSHYYVALSNNPTHRFLLETSYKYIVRYNSNEQQLWLTAEERAVDIAAAGGDVFVLSRANDSPAGMIRLYRDGAELRAFRPNHPIHQPRALAVSDNAVYILDHAGNRLQILDRLGRLQEIRQFRHRTPITALWVTPDDTQLILATTDKLFFYGQNQTDTTIPGPPDTTFRPHNPTLLASIPPLLSPIGGSAIGQRENHMPGAPRHYRLGIHGGVDFYWQRNTPVRAVADGTVIRALTDYTPPTPAQFAAQRAQALELGYTTADALDFYRGRQVWIEHDNGLISYYNHLAAITPGITVGARVTRGQQVGTVGNSGSPASLESPTADAHLHFELWLNNHYLGQYLRPIEIREWLDTLFYQ